mmetsp:Transcript_16731/g.33456  ORF Transcript_16731/g.33456 Transcript_16731/m.33456 type:complete len:478 (+) Transcript_16731:96-1529(+)
MTPWIQNYTPIDREAWKTFPTTWMRAAWVLTPLSAGFYLGLPWWGYLIMAALTTPIIFVSFFYFGSRFQIPWDAPGDATEWLDFKNPKDAARYKGKRIDMETLFEMYFDEELDFRNPDLHHVLSHRYEFCTFEFSIWGHLKFLVTQWVPELLAHNKKQDSEQVKDHYNRGNITNEGEDDFYGCFLGDRMVYTSGIAITGEETLEQMQDNKMALVCSKIGLKSTDRHLDIGCGWGSLVNYSAENYKHHCTGVTLAENQVAYATKVADKKGIRNNVNYLCMDYRDIPKEKFNKITCLEMAEHVGVKNFSSFLAQVHDMLEDDGVFFLQIAGLRRAFQYEDLIWGLFMAKYIFPGADASMPLGWVVTQVEAAGFEVAHVDTIGIHYSLTIKKWWENWCKNKMNVVPKYGEKWYRIFNLFLAWSSIISGTGPATCFQLTLHKNRNNFNRKQFITSRLKPDAHKPTLPVNGYAPVTANGKAA